MSNEYKDWLYDKLQDVLLQVGAIDKVLQVIVWEGDNAGVVHGVKDGIHVKYTVFMEDDGSWDYEQEFDNLYI